MKQIFLQYLIGTVLMLVIAILYNFRKEIWNWCWKAVAIKPREAGRRIILRKWSGKEYFNFWLPDVQSKMMVYYLQRRTVRREAFSTFISDPIPGDWIVSYETPGVRLGKYLIACTSDEIKRWSIVHYETSTNTQPDYNQEIILSDIWNEQTPVHGEDEEITIQRALEVMKENSVAHQALKVLEREISPVVGKTAGANNSKSQYLKAANAMLSKRERVVAWITAQVSNLL